jgi:hypothetical protein
MPTVGAQTSAEKCAVRFTNGQSPLIGAVRVGKDSSECASNTPSSAGTYLQYRE